MQISTNVNPNILEKILNKGMYKVEITCKYKKKQNLEANSTSRRNLKTHNKIDTAMALRLQMVTK